MTTSNPPAPAGQQPATKALLCRPGRRFNEELYRIRRHVLLTAHAFARRGFRWNRDFDASHNLYSGPFMFRLDHVWLEGPEVQSKHQVAEVHIRLSLAESRVDEPCIAQLPEAVISFDRYGRATVHLQETPCQGGAGKRRTTRLPTPPPGAPDWPLHAVVSYQSPFVLPLPPFFETYESADAHWHYYSMCEHVVDLDDAGAACPHCEGPLAAWEEKPVHEVICITALCIDAACAAQVGLVRDREGTVVVTDRGYPRTVPTRQHDSVQWQP